MKRLNLQNLLKEANHYETIALELPRDERRKQLDISSSKTQEQIKVKIWKEIDLQEIWTPENPKMQLPASRTSI